MKDIVVGVDSSPTSECALDRALLEAERTGQPLRVVHAWSTPVWATGGGAAYVLPPPDPAASKRSAQDLLDESVEKALGRRTSRVAVAITTEVHEGLASRVLTRLGDEAAQVVVGGSGHGQLASALLGSTTTYVLHHARCPVMVVPAGLPATPFARVVVGLDGSTSSRAAFRWGLEAARSVACPMVAVHGWVISRPPVPVPYSSLPMQSTYEQEAQNWLEGEVRELLDGDAQTVVQSRVPYSHAAAALLDESGPSDLLVVGSRGHGGFTSLVLGSVATQCATHATSTVVVVKEAKS